MQMYRGFLFLSFTVDLRSARAGAYLFQYKYNQRPHQTTPNVESNRCGKTRKVGIKWLQMLIGRFTLDNCKYENASVNQLFEMKSYLCSHVYNSSGHK